MKKYLLFLLSMLVTVLITGCHWCMPQEERETVRTVEAPQREQPRVVEQVRVVEKIIHAQEGYVKVEANMPKEVVVGQPYKYQIIVTNLIEDCGVDDVVVMQELGNMFEFQSSSPQARLTDDNVAIWNIGELGIKESRVINVTGIATQAGEVIKCSKVDYRKKRCEVVNAVQPKLNLDLEMPMRAMSCENIPARITVTNTGTGMAREPKVTLELPEGLVSNGQRTLNWNIPSLEQGRSYDITFNVAAQRTGNFDTEAMVKALDGLRDSEKSAIRIMEPVLKITMTGPKKIYLGRSINYTVKVENKGDATAKDMLVQASVPENTRYIASEGGIFSNNSVFWKLPALEPGHLKRYEFSVSAGKSGEATSKAAAKALCAEKVMTKHVAKVFGIPAILLEVVDVNDPVEVGQQETYIITATNQGSATATNVIISAEITDHQKLISSTGPSRGTIEGRKIVFEALKRLPPKKSAAWRVNVSALKAGSVRFKVKMTSDQLKGQPVEETEATTLY